MANGPAKDEVTFFWYGTSAHPEMGMISFARPNGRITRIEDGLRSLAGPGYEVESGGIVKASRDGPPAQILSFEGRPWALGFFRNRLVAQVSDDDGKTGPVYFLHRGEPEEVVGEPVGFPIRTAGSAFFSYDEETASVRIYEIGRSE